VLLFGRHASSFLYSELLQELILMLTNDEQEELLAAERHQFPGNADLGRVDTQKATILGQAWVKWRRAEIQREAFSQGESS
tara:strand:- start:377 stop:619 length:243 start_codon:yes stop_codon:yes gene_type:complete